MILRKPFYWTINKRWYLYIFYSINTGIEIVYFSDFWSTWFQLNSETISKSAAEHLLALSVFSCFWILIGIVFQPSLSDVRCLAEENRCRYFGYVGITMDAAILSASSVSRAKQKYWDTLTFYAAAFLQKKTTVFGNKNRNIQILVVCPQHATIKISQYKFFLRVHFVFIADFQRHNRSFETLHIFLINFIKFSF